MNVSVLYYIEVCFITLWQTWFSRGIKKYETPGYVYRGPGQKYLKNKEVKQWLRMKK